MNTLKRKALAAAVFAQALAGIDPEKLYGAPAKPIKDKPANLDGVTLAYENAKRKRERKNAKRRSDHPEGT